MRLYYSDQQRERGYFVAACLSLYDHQCFFESTKTLTEVLRACLETHLSIMKRFNSMLAMAI